MGEVWLAQQSSPVKRKVALKLIKLGMDTRQVVARFEAERQALAVMDHPNIASVYDGGATETFDTDHPNLRQTLEAYADVLDATGRTGEATRTRARLGEQ